MSEPEAVWIGVATFEVATPGVRSLKEKRGLIVPMVERLRQRFPVSVARLAGLDSLDRETIGAVVINTDPALCRKLLERVHSFASDFGLRVENVRLEVERWD